ncbi:MAG: SIS domain-containing protein [Nitrospina sp.]|nr:SIS domain-containing protein [Nitrospina sp.]
MKKMKMDKVGDLSLASYTDQFHALLACCEITKKNGALSERESGLSSVMKELVHVRKNQGSVYVIGNGGSAGVASHTVIDLVNVAKLRAFTLHEPSVLTCLANDYGYEQIFSRLLSQMARPGDVLIAISSSGNSKNICNAAEQMTSSGGVVITLSGFTSDNSLRSLGDINIWLDSKNYGLVEIGHQFILHNVSDRFGMGYAGMEAP